MMVGEMPGVRPGGRLTFLASPRKVSKRRRPCPMAPAGSAAVLAIQGRAQLVSFTAFTSLKQGARSQSLRALRACPELLCSSPMQKGGRAEHQESRLAARRLELAACAPRKLAF